MTLLNFYIIMHIPKGLGAIYIIYNIKYLLNRREQFILVILAFLLLIGMFLEVLGIGILVPTLEIITDPEMGLANEWVQRAIIFFKINLHFFSIKIFVFFNN